MVKKYLICELLLRIFHELQTLKSPQNNCHPDTSFCMQTDRYPDSKHKKFQTDTLIINAFSVELNLANNPKYCMMCMVRVATSNWDREGQLALREPLWLSPYYCLHFAPVTFKANQHAHGHYF